VVALGGEVEVHGGVIVEVVVVVVHGVVVVVVEVVDVVVDVDVVDVVVDVDEVEVVGAVGAVGVGVEVGVVVGGVAGCAWPARVVVCPGWAGAVCCADDPVGVAGEPPGAGWGCCQYTARLSVRSSCPARVMVACRSRRVTSAVGWAGAGVAGLVPPRARTAAADRVARLPAAAAMAGVRGI
jgi:hypothetical protein